MPADQEDPGNDIPSRRSPASTVLLSGGLDSATALASIVARGGPTSSLFIDYGQQPRIEERHAARAIAEKYGSEEHSEIEIDGLNVGDGEIRGRNALLLLAALTATEPPASLVLGVHSGSDYWDCSREFLARMQAVFNGYSAGAHQVLAPFAALFKPDIHRLAAELGVDPGLTYSCEHVGGPCGSCRSCKDIQALAG